MFSRHVFPGHTPQLGPYIVTYAINYGLSLSLLMVAHHFIKSPYIAGFVTLTTVSVINYFLLKQFVFKHKRPPL